MGIRRFIALYGVSHATIQVETSLNIEYHLELKVKLKVLVSSALEIKHLVCVQCRLPYDGVLVNEGKWMRNREWHLEWESTINGDHTLLFRKSYHVPKEINRIFLDFFVVVV